MAGERHTVVAQTPEGVPNIGHDQDRDEHEHCRAEERRGHGEHREECAAAPDQRRGRARVDDDVCGNRVIVNTEIGSS